MVTKTQNIRFNPFNAQFRNNPYPTYDYLRVHDPIHWSFLSAWVLTRYSDIKTVLKDSRFVTPNIIQGVESKSKYLSQKQQNLDALAEMSRHFLFFIDPPYHTRMKALWAKVFNMGIVEKMRTPIQNIVHELINQVESQGEMEFMADFAQLLTGRVISQIIGLPKEDQGMLHQWSLKLLHIFDPLVFLKDSQAMNQAALNFSQYLKQEIECRRQHPQADLISRFLHLQKQDSSLSDEEIISNCIMLYMTGEQSITATLGNGFLALLRHQDQLELLQNNLEIMPKAVEEMMRYDSAVPTVVRMAKEDMEMSGKRIKSGDSVVLCLNSANRDPEIFPHADQLDLTRKENRHLAFAGGAHFCIGSMLARIEIPIAFQILLARLNNFELVTEELEYLKYIAFRPLKSLPIKFTSCSKS